VTETTYTTYNYGLVSLEIVLLILSAALLVGGVIGYRKSNSTVERIFTTIAVIGGAIILLTLSLRGVEVLPEAPFWFLMLFQLGLLSMLFWSWMLADCAVNEPREGNHKIVWVVVILFTHVFGAGLYLLVRRPQRLSEAGSSAPVQTHRR
jgi:hypothetical protein